MTLPPGADAAAPTGWLFRPRSLGSSLRIFLPSLIVARLIGLGRIFLFVYLILQDEYGLFRLALLAVNILAALGQLGVPAGLERYAPAYEATGQLRRYLRRGFLIGLAVSLLMTAVMAACADPLSRLLFAGPDGSAASAGYLFWLTMACLLVMLLLTAYYRLQGACRGLRAYRAIALLEVLHSVSFVVFVLIGLFAVGGRKPDGGGAIVLLVSYAASLLVSLVAVRVPLSRHLRRWPGQDRPLFEPVRRTLAQLMRFASFALLATLVWEVLMFYGLWYLTRERGRSAAGLYAFSRDLMQWAPFLALAVWRPAQNAATRLWVRPDLPDGRSRAVAQLGRVLRLFSWPMWLLAAGLVLSANLWPRVLPPDYRDVTPLLPWVLVFFLGLSNYGLAYAQAVLLENTRIIFIAAAAALVTHVASSWWLVGGAGGLAGAVGIAQSAALAVAAATVTLWLLLAGVLRGRPWLSARDLLVTLAPALLLLPWALPRGGGAILAVAALAVVVLLGLSPWLWTGEDRKTLRAYLGHSFSILRRSRPNP